MKKRLRKRFSILPIIYGSSSEEMRTSLEYVLSNCNKKSSWNCSRYKSNLDTKKSKCKNRSFIFREIQKLNIPIILHANGAILNNTFSRPYTAKHSLFCVNAMSILTELYISGFFDQFKKIKFVF